MQKQRPKLRVVGHYMSVDGEQVEIDPGKTDLPDRCKVALAEMQTGKKYELVVSSSA